MAEIQQSFDVTNGGKKRKSGKKKGKMAKKRQRVVMPPGAEKKVKVDKKMRKLFQKRARDYNSDEVEEDEDEDVEQLPEPGRSVGVKTGFMKRDDDFGDELSDDDEEENQGSEPEEVSEDENGGIQPGVTKFAEGIKAFKLAFKKIVKKSGGDVDVLGPVLSAHKKLIAEKLAEEEAEKKAKGVVKKEKHLSVSNVHFVPLFCLLFFCCEKIAEKGHVKLENYLDAHEKHLLGVATKGGSVVKLFNAVNKAQSAQRGLNMSRSKDEKGMPIELRLLCQTSALCFVIDLDGQYMVILYNNNIPSIFPTVIKQKRKEAFFSELGKAPSQSSGTAIKVGTSGGEAPAWAPLRDNYMLTNPKLKDWDKMQEPNTADDFGRQSESDSSSDDN
ncbi:RRP15-like protein [Striga asiatica]|uniref:RRP15-like protein n=1 Tax=Striga asiatica TaxID=4170 RepID=A0A5A7PLG6_STRAF|nr:RRP15-like protein [Striga asiatica]